MCIETTTVALLLASYFYLWRNYPQEHWPPPRVEHEPPILKPVPDLLVGTLNVLLLLATVPLMAWIDRLCCRQFDELERLNASKPSPSPPREARRKRPRLVIGGCWR